MRKFSFTFLSFLTAILLFIASFSLLLENDLFNSGYYKSAFERLGTYERIAELAGKPARELSEKMSTPSVAVELSAKTAVANLDQQGFSLKSIIDENVSDKMVRLNVDSLISGLVSYFTGETDSLPNLYLTGSVALKSVNLQVLIMYMGESHITNILHIIGLSQFIVVHIPEVILFLFPVILLLILNKSAKAIYTWLRSTAFFYCMICFSAGLLIQLLPRILMKPVLSGVDAFQPALAELLSVHIFYFSNVFSVTLLLSGSLLYVGVHAFIHTIMRSSLNLRYVTPTAPLKYPDRTAVKAASIKRVSINIAIILLSGILLYTGIQSARKEFDNRNLGQTLSLLWGNNPLYRVTDARDDLVYLLEVHMVDSTSKKPVSNVGINIENSSRQDSGFQTISCLTDKDGTAVFMVDKGLYSLTLDSYNMFTGYSNSQLHSYQFEMLTPGRSVLNVMLGERTNGLPYMADASLQYMP